MYEEYMNNLLGIKLKKNDYNFDYRNLENVYPYNYMNFQNPEMFQDMDVQNLETLYPEMYNLIYPMIKKVCMQNTEPITEELIDNMTYEIYNNIEAGGDIINVNIDIGDNNSVENKTGSESNNQSNLENNRGSNRQNNGVLSDLIKILILRELIGNPNMIRPMPPPPPGRRSYCW